MPGLWAPWPMSRSARPLQALSGVCGPQSWTVQVPLTPVQVGIRCPMLHGRWTGEEEASWCRPKAAGSTGTESPVSWRFLLDRAAVPLTGL